MSKYSINFSGNAPSGLSGESVLNDFTQLPSVTAGLQQNPLRSPVDTQPQHVNYLYQTFFKFDIFRLPKMEYFVQRVNLPGFGAAGSQEQPSRFVAAKHPNTRVSFDNLSITFLVDEDMSNWRELYDWMKTIYLVNNHKNFEDDISTHFTDGSLHILNSAMNGNKEIRFRNLLPVSLTGLDFDSTVTDLTPFTAEVNFAFDYYEFV